ncbi:hypothetical protein ACLX1H_008808 [Fusarium chlamydosporum]
MPTIMGFKPINGPAKIYPAAPSQAPVPAGESVRQPPAQAPGLTFTSSSDSHSASPPSPFLNRGIGTGHTPLPSSAPARAPADAPVPAPEPIAFSAPVPVRQGPSHAPPPLPRSFASISGPSSVSALNPEHTRVPLPDSAPASAPAAPHPVSPRAAARTPPPVVASVCQSESKKRVKCEICLQFHDHKNIADHRKVHKIYDSEGGPAYPCMQCKKHPEKCWVAKKPETMGTYA